jgi:hypothetical protein
MLTDEQIFDILDGRADAETLQQHTPLLANSLAYQQYFKELEAIHIDLAAMPLEHTSAHFTENVLAAIPVEKPILVLIKKKAWSSKLIYIFIGTLAAILLTTIIIVVFYQPSSETIVEQPNIIFEELSSFMAQHFTKVGILLNLIVMLVIFDRKVLRPYFQQRRITLS